MKASFFSNHNLKSTMVKIPVILNTKVWLKRNWCHFGRCIKYKVLTVYVPADKKLVIIGIIKLNVILNIRKFENNSYQLLRHPTFHILLIAIQSGTWNITEPLKCYVIFLFWLHSFSYCILHISYTQRDIANLCIPFQYPIWDVHLWEIDLLGQYCFP